MRLCDRDIYQHLQDGKIKIDPTPSYDQISGVTVDIRLGNKFRVFEDHQAPSAVYRFKWAESTGSRSA